MDDSELGVVVAKVCCESRVLSSRLVLLMGDVGVLVS